MIIDAPASDLARAIEQCLRVVGTQRHRGAVRLRCAESIVVESVSDTAFARLEVAGDVSEAGTVCLIGPVIGHFLSSAQPQTCRIGTAADRPGWVAVTSGDFRARFPLTQDVRDLPDLDTVTVRCPAPALARAIERAQAASAREILRPALHGVRIEVEGSNLVVVGLDGRRMAADRVPIQEGPGWDSGVTVDSRFATEIRRRVVERNPSHIDVGVSAGHNFTTARAEGTLFGSLNIADTYPDWRPAVPSDYTLRIVIDRRRLIESLRLLTTITEASGGMVTMGPSDGRLSLVADSEEDGQGEVALDAEIEGVATALRISGSELVDGLSVIDGDLVDLRVQSSMRPLTARAADSAGFIYVTMPARDR